MRGFGTRGRFRVAAVGLPAPTVPGASPSSAGAQTVTQWNVQGNGGFVSLGLLNSIQIAGGGSEADASSSPVAESSGTGLCFDTTAASNPCPTTATSSLSGDGLKSTQQAVAHGNGVTATPAGQTAAPALSGMGLAGLTLIGRRRIASAIRLFNLTLRRRGGL